MHNIKANFDKIILVLKDILKGDINGEGDCTSSKKSLPV